MIFLNEEFNSITYDENWQNVSEPETPVLASIEDEPDNGGIKLEKRKKSAPKHILLTVQLVCCILSAVAAFVLKGIGGEVYEAVKDWYFTQLNDTAIFDGGSNGIPQLLNNSATADEV